MRTIQYLTGPDSALFWPAIAAGAAVALICGLLSVFVVLRRLAFIGHGVSHAAFGGVGVAAVLGLNTINPDSAAAYLAVVGGFCVGAAVLIALVSARSQLREDTVIGVALVGSMALGALLLQLHVRRGGSAAGASLEASLFGSILSVRPAEAAAAWIVALGVAAAVFLMRRPIIFWAFDEPAAEACGVSPLRTRLALMALLGVAVVAAMKLAGVLLATALLVIPGAIALRLSQRLLAVFALSMSSGLIGVLGGIALSLEADWPPGPCVVVVLIAMMFAAALIGTLRR